jgi:hypothetical protein
MQLFKAFSPPSFLLADEGHPRLVYYLLETINSILYHQFNGMSPLTSLLSNIVRKPSTLRPANSPLWVKRQKADVLENPNFVYSVLRSHQDFQTLATFTLMSGLRDIQKKKANRAGTSSPHSVSPSPLSTSFLSSYLIPSTFPTSLLQRFLPLSLHALARLELII